VIHYHPATCLERDTCVLCGDSDIASTDVLRLPDALWYPYMLCADCARLPSVTAVVEGALTKVVRRRDWLQRPLSQ
jgi:hypothetical protein